MVKLSGLGCLDEGDDSIGIRGRTGAESNKMSNYYHDTHISLAIFQYFYQGKLISLSDGINRYKFVLGIILPETN